MSRLKGLHYEASEYMHPLPERLSEMPTACREQPNRGMQFGISFSRFVEGPPNRHSEAIKLT